MAIKITVPRLGWSMDEGTLTEWLKRDGDYVKKGDMIFVLEGDKAAQEIECFDEGILRLLPNGPRSGDTVQVGQLLAYLVAEGEPVPAAGVAEAETSSAAASNRDPRIPAVSRSMSAAEVQGTSQRLASSPRARRRAAELGVDWTKLGTGTGRNGRIREQDVLAASRGQTGQSIQPLSPIRRTIAERMVASLRTTAPRPSAAAIQSSCDR
jgi:pyruvate dehydrogenase E2 component (dihydrolipoamide acetyltransferase)